MINLELNNENQGASLATAFDNTIMLDTPDEEQECFANNVSIQDVMNSYKRNGGSDWEKNYKKNIYTQANQNVQTNLNQVMTNLAKNYNQTASIYNKQADILNRHEDIVDENSKKINRQFQDLNEISEQIALKSRIIELNDEMARKKVVIKKIVFSFLVVLPFFLIPIILITTGGIPPIAGFIILAAIVLGYVIYGLVVYIQNKEKYFKPIIIKKVNDFDSKVKGFYDRERSKFQKELQNFVYGECECPEEEAIVDDSEYVKEQLKKFLDLVPANTPLSKYQELFSILGCSRNLTDKDIEWWKTRNTMQEVINDIKAYYRLASQCKGSKEQNDFCLPELCTKQKYLLKENGPFMYYDGSAPPQQVHPIPVGAVNIEMNGKIFNFPEDAQKIMENVDNPIKRLFFILWAEMLRQNGINFNDPRFKSKLNIIELEVAGSDPEPYWDKVRLPLVNEFDDTIKVVCQKYNSDRKDLGQGVGQFLNDTWHFMMEDQIPTDIYQRWIKKLNEAVKNKKKVEDVYREFTNEVMNSNRFKRKWGNMNNYLDIKVRELFDKYKSGYHFADPEVEKIGE